MKRVLLAAMLICGTFFIYDFLITEVLFKKYNFIAVYNGAIKKLITNKLPSSSRPTLVFGDSMSNKIETGLIKKESYNLSVLFGDPMLTYHILKKFKEKNNFKLGCVILSFSYAADMRYKNDEFFNTIVAQDFYDTAEILEIYKTGKTHAVFPVGYMSDTEYFYKAIKALLKFGGYKIEELQNSILTFNKVKNYYRQGVQIYINSGNQKKTNMIVSDKEFEFAEKFFIKKFVEDKTYDFYLKKILEELDSNTAVAYVVMPAFSEKNQDLIDLYLENLVEHVSKMVQQRPEALVIRPKIPMLKKYFIDSNHLNEEGALLFTEKVKELLPKQCLL